MKIGIFTDTYYPQLNGVTISIDNFVSALERKGHEVYIFAPKVSKYHKKEKNIFRLRSLKVLSSEPEGRIPLYVPDKTMQAIFKHDFDVIHAHGNGPFSILGYQVAKIKRVPYILTFHTLHTEYAHYILDGKVISPRMIAAALRVSGNLCDGIITPSIKMQEKLISFGVTKPITIIPSFIDTKKYSSLRKGYLRSLLHLPQDTPIILSVGRLGKEKNFEFIIKMFKKVTLKDDTSHLVIVGQGPEIQKLKNLVGKLNLEDRVHLTGRIPYEDMPKVYADSDIFVFSSTTETQGLCILEAAVSKLPLVVVNDKAYTNLVYTGVNGYSLPLRQQAFADKVVELLQNKNKRLAFGKAAREMGLKNFQGNELTDRLISFYEGTINHYSSKDKILTRVNKAALVRLYRATSVLDRFLNK